jgi:hypothetical protein
MQKFSISEAKRDMSHTRLFRVAVRTRNADARPVTAVPGRDIQTVH